MSQKRKIGDKETISAEDKGDLEESSCSTGFIRIKKRKVSDKEIVSAEDKGCFEKLSGSTGFTHNSYTIGWVCALPKERTAATAMLDCRHPDLSKPRNDPNTYTLGSIGNHNIAIACLPKGQFGNNSAATVATWMISTFPSIKFGLMVGIGGGVPPKVRLGDVVVSTPGVVQWDFGKAKEGGNFERTGLLDKPPSALRTALAKLESDHELNGSRIPEYLDELEQNWPRLVPKYLKSDSLEDVLFRANYAHISKGITDPDVTSDDGDKVEEGEEDEEDESCRFCDKTKIVTRKPREMRVLYGLIASGNQVIKDAIFRDRLNKDLGGQVLCFEMEAAGLMNSFPCIVIRGICDYADSHKNKKWQEHAAAVAAAFGKELLEYVQPTDLEGERTANDILNQVNNTLFKVETSIKTMKNTLDNRDDLEILDWLTPINYGTQQSDFLKKRQPGTGQWFFDSVEYKAWVKTGKQTLFCPGIPGAGKTVLTSIVIEDLTARFSNSSTIGIAYIYCNFNRQDDQKIDKLLASLLKQLCEGCSLPDTVKTLYNKHKTKRTQPSLDEIVEVLESTIAIYSQVFIIVDALDECQVSDGCRTRFISELFKLQIKYNTNIFATSRLIPEIVDRFKENINLEIRADRDDVERYLEDHMKQLPAFVQRDKLLREEIKTGISEVVDGMFLLAQIYFNSLDDKLTPNDIRCTLKDFRRQIPGSGENKKTQILAFAYNKAMKRIDGQKSGFKELAKRVLMWLTCAKRQLITSELRCALAVKTDETEFDEGNLPQIEDMVSACAGLVIVDEESKVIRLIHYTAQEYFERKQGELFPNAMTNITAICITYLSYSIFDDGFCQTDKGFEERLRLNPFYNYSAHNWGHHAHGALGLCQKVVRFLEGGPKIEAASQALLATKWGTWDSNYTQRAPKHMTGLHLAANFGLKIVMGILLENKHDLNVITNNGRTPLSYAAENGHEAVVKLLVEKGADLESKDRHGRTPLLWAVRNRHEAVVKLLAEKGADLESGDEYSRTPLWWAVGNGHKAMVKLLVEKGADLESKYEYSRTPLSWAAENGHEAIIKLLVEKGADLKSKDGYSRTPLSWAAENGHKAIVKLLVKKGADLESKDEYGRTPLSWAAGNGHKAATKLLVEKGADLESKDRHGWTPLSRAAKNRHEAVAKLLVEKGADLESEDEYSRTPLSWAVGNGHEAIVKLLVEKGADLESEDEYSRTPLSWAAENGHEAIVKLLVKKGADLESEDEYGRTPLWWAAKNGHEAVVKLLLEKGTKKAIESC